MHAMTVKQLQQESPRIILRWLSGGTIQDAIAERIAEIDRELSEPIYDVEDAEGGE